MTDHPEFSVIFGCNGPIGRELTALLLEEGETVRGVCRSGRADLPPGVEVVAGDAADANASAALSAGARTIYCCIGLDYTRWPELWPPIVEGLLQAAAESGAPWSSPTTSTPTAREPARVTWGIGCSRRLSADPPLASWVTRTGATPSPSPVTSLTA
jgi:hypothetical protein